MITPAVAWLIAELTRLALLRLDQNGQLGTLTDEQAKAIVAQYEAAFPDILPTPEELES
jgi:hypothetical protein